MQRLWPVWAICLAIFPSMSLILASEKPVATSPALTASPAHPHIIVIVVDDMGLGDLGCYGGKIQPTPALDQLASEGKRWTQFYSASCICSPSRAALVTGRYPGRHKITSYLQTRAGNKACGQADFLSPTAPSMARIFKSIGYRTCHLGKWHLGGGRDVTNAPKFAAYGYDHAQGTWESPEPATPLGKQYPPWSEQLEPGQVHRSRRTHWLVDQTMEFLQKDPQQPALITLWLDDVHVPFRPSQEQLSALQPDLAPPAKDVTERDRYRAVMANLDTQMGRLIEAIRQKSMAEKTVVVFMGDNGPLPTFDQERTGGLRGSKLSLYEGGIRVPLIVWQPGRIPSGAVDDRTVLTSLDLLPTLLAYAGGSTGEQLLASNSWKLDGHNCSGCFTQATITPGIEEHQPRADFWEYGRKSEAFAFPKDAANRSPFLAMREGPWKLLVDHEGQHAELYQLEIDPQETTNRASAEQARVAAMTRRLLTWYKDVYQVPTP